VNSQATPRKHTECLPFLNCIFLSPFTIIMQFTVPYDKTNILMIVLFQSGICVQICDFQSVIFRGVRKIILRDN